MSAALIRHERLQATMYVKGLLEMMFEVQSEWIDTFINDMDSLAAAEALNTPIQGSSTPPSSANTSPRGSCQSNTPSGDTLAKAKVSAEQGGRDVHFLGYISGQTGIRAPLIC